MDTARFAHIVPIVVPLAGIVVAGVIGVLVERLILDRLGRRAQHAHFPGYALATSALRGVPIVIALLIGINAALYSLPIRADVLVALQRVLLIVGLGMATVVVARIIVGIVAIYGRRSSALLASASLFASIANALVYILGGLIVLQALGISITPILTALGVGGLAVALALKDTLSNLFSGLQIIASQQLRPGDFIKIENAQQGYVVDITWRNTTIRELSNNLIVVPNEKLASAIYTNYALPDAELNVSVEVSVAYESDLEEVERVTIEAARAVMRDVGGPIDTFDPYVRYRVFADSGIAFTVFLRSGKFLDQFKTKHAFIKRLHAEYKRAEIDIPYPVRRIVGDAAK
jgi:small-conductance mechanosensitive channel